MSFVEPSYYCTFVEIFGILYWTRATIQFCSPIFNECKTCIFELLRNVRNVEWLYQEKVNNNFWVESDSYLRFHADVVQNFIMCDIL